MTFLRRLGLVAVLAALVAAVFGGTAGAIERNDPPFGFANHVVFVQNDNVAGNQVIAYDRASDGHLTLANTYSTGGLGGILAGSVVDHLASQGSLTYDPDHSLLYAVNAGSNSVSVFAVHGDQLRLIQVIDSGGTFPVSVAVHRNLVYVLNAENGASVQGYAVFFNHLVPIPGSRRPLGLDPNATPQFVNTPGQVAFSPDGSPADRDDQGQRERHRRVPGRSLRVPLGDTGGQLGAGNRSLRRQLRPRRSSRRRRRGHERAGELHAQRQRIAHAPGVRRNRTGRNLLGRSRRFAVLRLQRRERDRSAVTAPPSTANWRSSARPPPTRAPLTPRCRQTASSSTSREAATGQSTRSTSTPTDRSPRSAP